MAAAAAAAAAALGRGGRGGGERGEARGADTAPTIHSLFTHYILTSSQTLTKRYDDSRMKEIGTYQLQLQWFHMPGAASWVVLYSSMASMKR